MDWSPIDSMPYLSIARDWVWIGGQHNGFVGITFNSSNNNSLTAWMNQTIYCELSGYQSIATDLTTAVFLKADDVIMSVVRIDRNTGNMSALLCDMTAEPTAAKLWITSEIDNSLLNFLPGTVSITAASNASTNVNHPVFLAVQNPGGNVLVQYNVERLGKCTCIIYSIISFLVLIITSNYNL